jgi:methyl-accepting chemotaxis protein
MNEKRRAIFRLLFAFSVFLNIVLLCATGWFANRDSRSQSLVRELKRNLEQLESQLATGIDRAGSLRNQIQSVVDANAGTYRAVDTSLDIAEDLGRIVGNLGRAIDRSAERTDQLRGEIAAARQRIEESLEGIGRIQETGGRSAASYNEIRSRLERGISDIDQFLAANPE